MPGTLNLSADTGCDTPVIVITCKDSLGAAFPLAGWKAYAEVRKFPESGKTLDLAPEIAADDAAGTITIPSIPWATTDDLRDGVYYWDLILEDGDGVRYPPLLAGTYTIGHPITQPGVE